MSSNSEKKFGSCEVCLMACMAYYSSVGKTDVSREDIATFEYNPPPWSERGRFSECDRDRES